MRILPLILLASLPAAAHGEALGRFFFTPQERQALDAQRAGLPATSTGAPPNALGPAIALQGLVKRNSGRYTVWINGAPYDETTARQLAQAPDKNARLVVTPPNARPLTLKPGQRADVQSGTVRDAYQPAPAGGTSPAP
jgi:hypothetical protein